MAILSSLSLQKYFASIYIYANTEIRRYLSTRFLIYLDVLVNIGCLTLKLRCTDRNVCYTNHRYYTICLVLESGAEETLWLQATVVFYPVALSVSQLFTFLESAVKSLISSFKGTEDVTGFPLACTFTKYFGEPVILGNPEYLISEVTCW